MSKALKQTKRSKLTAVLNEQQLRPDVLFVTSFRPTANNTLQVELCQNRRLGGRKRTVIGMVNRSDNRFSSDTTLLFDWMKLEPKDMLATFPELAKHYSEEDLAAIAESYDADAPKGTDATVFAAIHSIPHIVDTQTGEKCTPVIAVTEVTQTQLSTPGGFYTGPDAEDKIENELENGKSVMRTSSAPDAEYIVDGQTGDKIHRFTRTMIKEDYPNNDWDSLISDKMTESAYKQQSARRNVSQYIDPENIQVPSIVGDDDEI